MLPAKVCGIYLPNWTKTTLLDIPSSYNLVYAAFAYGDGSGTGTVVFNSDDGSGLSATTFKAQMQTLQMRGTKIILSLGGSNPVGLQLLTQNNVNELVNSVNSIVDSFGFDGIDWDLEQTNIYTVANLLACTKAWKAKYGDSFIVAAAPGPSVTQYKQFAQQAGTLLDLTCMQYYDYADSNRLAGIQSRTAELINTYGVPANRIGVGCKTGTDSLTAPASYWKDVFSSMLKLYPDFRGGMVWEADYEKRTGNQFASLVNPVILANTIPVTPVVTTTTTVTPTPVVTTQPLPIAKKVYTVVSGDTLKRIGQKTGVNWLTIAKLNNLRYPYQIYVGQVLKLN